MVYAKENYWIVTIDTTKNLWILIPAGLQHILLLVPIQTLISPPSPHVWFAFSSPAFRSALPHLIYRTYLPLVSEEIGFRFWLILMKKI